VLQLQESSMTAPEVQITVKEDAVKQPTINEMMATNDVKKAAEAAGNSLREQLERIKNPQGE